MWVHDIPVTDFATVDATGCPDARPVALLVGKFAADWSGWVKGIRDGRGIDCTRGNGVIRIQVGAHGHALVGPSELLELSDSDFRGDQGVKPGAHVAVVGEREFAFDLEKGSQHDDEHDHPSHDGQREDEGETFAGATH